MVKQSDPFNEASTPEHDALVMWCMQSDNLKTIARAYTAKRFPGMETRLSHHPERPPLFRCEVPVYDGVRRDGFLDGVIEGVSWTGGYDGALLIPVEVKPSTPSMGDLLRQLARYEHGSYRPHGYGRGNEKPVGKLVVVSYDARFADIIQQQGHAFVLVPRPEHGP